jgi:transcriptional regulator with XRE-family HTH domain
MARKPAKRHVIAEIRLRAGLSQSELAELLGCAAVTVQRIEQGKLALSEDLAGKAQESLDISAAWLLANNPTELPVTPRNDLWTKDYYELTQGTPPGHSYKIHHEVPAADGETLVNKFTALKLAEASARIQTMLERTKGLPKQGILLHRLNKALDALEEDFNPGKIPLEKLQPEIKKARKAFDETLKRNSDREAERIWRDRPAESKK